MPTKGSWWDSQEQHTLYPSQELPCAHTDPGRVALFLRIQKGGPLWAPRLALIAHVEPAAQRLLKGEWVDTQGSDLREHGQSPLLARAIRYSPHQCYSSGKSFKPQGSHWAASPPHLLAGGLGRGGHTSQLVPLCPTPTPLGFMFSGSSEISDLSLQRQAYLGPVCFRSCCA